MKKKKMRIVFIVMLVCIVIFQCSQFVLYGIKQELSFSYTGGVETLAKDNYYQSKNTYREATLGGTTAYCVDYQRRLPSGTMRYVRTLSPQATAVLMYGYPNRSASQLGVANNKEAYYATQLAFWLVVGRTGEATKARCVLNLSNLSAKPGYEAFLSRCKSAASNLANQAFSNPYSANPRISLNTNNAKVTNSSGRIYIGPYTVTATDCKVNTVNARITNNSYNAFTTDYNGNVTNTFKLGQQFWVAVDERTGSGNVTLNINVNAGKNVGAVYTTGASNVQDYATIAQEGQQLTARTNVAWTGLSTKIRVEKVDQYGNPVEGAVFQLKNSSGNVVSQGTTGETGRIQFNNLKVGKYTLVETKAPNGYLKKNTTYDINATAGDIETIRVVNKKIEGGLKITKVDQDDATNPIAGVKFEILNSNKRVIATITTDEDGVATISDLEPGRYYYREISAPENVIIDKKEYSFDITTSNMIEKTIKNKIYSGGIRIEKVDNTSEAKPIEGVKFEILNSNKEVIDTIVTNEQGYAIKKGMNMGKYYYREVSAPENVIIDKKAYPFELTENQSRIEKKVVNRVINGAFRIVKADEDKTPIQDVKFEILDANKNVIETIITNAEGIAQTTKLLTVGKYYYREVEVPSAYLIDKKEYSFEITETKQKVSVNVVNKRVKGSLKIVKVDEFNKPLSGVKFQILDVNKKVVQTITTDESGNAVSKQLPIGTYYYKEVKVPDNVIIDAKEYQFNINSNEEIIEKEIVNNYKKGYLEITKVDQANLPIEGVKFNILNQNKEVVDTIVTDKDGKATSKQLTSGNYYYQEVEAPEEYILDDNLYKFKLQDNEQVVKKTVVNKTGLSVLKILKVDSETDEPLAGVKFEITNSKKTVTKTLVTGSDGVATITNLPLGTYYIKEVETLGNYILNGEEIQVDINKGNQVYEKKVKNEAKKLPVTGGFFSTDTTIIVTVSGISILGYVIYNVLSNKRQQKKRFEGFDEDDFIV